MLKTVLKKDVFERKQFLKLDNITEMSTFIKTSKDIHFCNCFLEVRESDKRENP